nr:beta-N-acetylglucosaminidase domain-containing protein [uncultured Porphyromonas sp.]
MTRIRPSWALPLMSALIAGSLEAQSLIPELYPRPQQVTESLGWLKMSTPLRQLRQRLDTLTLTQIRESKGLYAKANLRLGLKTDPRLSSYRTKVPTQDESYYLEVNSRGITLVGADSVGLYYGLQSLRQLLASNQVPYCKITDYPSVGLRGVVEGFYGNPYSHSDRIEQFKFYGRTKLNTYIYGPKDDPYHRDKWRELYPEQERKRISELVTQAHQRGVRFVWAIHPGLDIKWTEEDRKAVVRKCEDMYRLGVRSFAVFFDDISADDESARHQAELLNYLYEHFEKTGMKIGSLILCPTQYNQAWAKGAYLDILGTKMNPKIEIMWTGKTVVTMIDRETMEYVNARIRRKGFIWLNYPVTDFAVDHILLGPMRGNASDIDQLVSGFVANPMEYAEASKVGVFGVADYLWNMKAYDADRAWEGAVKELYPHSTVAFRHFAQDNVDPGANGHRFRLQGESRDIAPVITRFKESLLEGHVDRIAWSKLQDRFRTMAEDATILLADKTNEALSKELRPWLEVYHHMAQQGGLLLRMQRLLAEGKAEEFMASYKELQSIESKQGAIRSRDFAGSLNAPYPKPADQVIAPFLAWFKRQLYSDYRKAYTYEVDKLPTSLIEAGSYYIRVQGAYLTNTTEGVQLVAEADSINPQRQVWSISLDQESGNYIITNAQDQQRLNSSLKLTRSADNLRDSFVLHRNDKGHFALQNAKEALGYIWGLKDGKLQIIYRKAVKPEDYILELQPRE